MAAVDKKFAQEEFKAYHVALPRFLLWFVPGVMLNPLQWAVRHGKGRICVDCTNGPHGKGSSGSPNTFIPPPKDDKDECPQVYYASAWQRLLRYAWHLRATCPNDDILGHCDDIDAAFQRVLYHPDMATAFSYVFGAFLLVAVGQVFGARNAPSNFTLLLELRSYVASCSTVPSEVSDSLVESTVIAPSPTNVPLAPAISDQFNPLLTADELANWIQATFVDNNGKAAQRSRARQCLLQSVIAAHELFGYAHEDRRAASMNEEKWGKVMSPTFNYLGMLVDFHRMMVTWPRDKRADLKDLLDRILRVGKCTYVDAARIVGKLRAAADVSPWGVFIVWTVSQALAQVVRNARGAARFKRFWTQNSLRLNPQIRADLSLLASWLLDPDSSPLWSRPIGLLIERCAEAIFLSDASYAGVGGWSAEAGLMWRITRTAFLSLGFAMKDLQDWSDEPLSPSSPGLHINPLELLGLAINVWIALRYFAASSPPATGRILGFLADNTSALAWFRVAASCRHAPARNLSRFLSSLHLHAALQLTRLQGSHLAGRHNQEADRLSRSDRRTFPTWDCVIAQHPRLASCRICLIPYKLLLHLQRLLSSSDPVVTSETEMTALMSLELVILPLGSRPSELQDCISNV